MASEAELISVLDRILDSFPGLAEREWEFHISHIAGLSPPPPSLRLPSLTEADFAGLLPPTVLELLLERIPSSRRTDVCDILREIGGKTTFPHVRGKLGLARSVLDYLEKWAVAGAFRPAGSAALRD